MAKKKSKTQKYKKNQKKKMNKVAKVAPKQEKKIENKPITDKKEIEKKVNNNASTKPNVNKNSSKNNVNKNNANKKVRRNNSNYNGSRRNPNKKRQLVEKSKVKYNVPLTEPESFKKIDDVKEIKENKEIPKIDKIEVENNKKESLVKEKTGERDSLEKVKTLINVLSGKTKSLVNKVKGSFKKKQKPKEEIILPKKAKKIEDKKALTKGQKKKNIFIRLIYEIVTNIHILFNTALVIFFVVLLVGMIRIEVLTTGTIIYISLIVLFLMLIALSYNKYISGKIFTIVLCAGMGFAIYQMQYTYDFVRNLASNLYEYKTYYVVTFDNGINKSIYTINNKSVGLLKDNCINVERRLNTKLDGVNYLEYDDINLLFDDFYDSKYRAILVNENQYKYLQNNIQGQKAVKILYEFKVNEKK